MALGRKTGGRKAGTPNKRTQNVTEKLEALGCDPIAAMARMAKEAEKEGDKASAMCLYAELAPYYSPKRKAVEQTIIDPKPKKTREELEAQAREAEKVILEHMPEEKRRAFLMEALTPEERRKLLRDVNESEEVGSKAGKNVPSAPFPVFFLLAAKKLLPMSTLVTTDQYCYVALRRAMPISPRRPVPKRYTAGGHLLWTLVRTLYSPLFIQPISTASITLKRWSLQEMSEFGRSRHSPLAS